MSDGRRLEIPKVSVLEDNTGWREQITQLKAELRRVKGNLVVTEADLAKFGGHTKECVRYYHKVKPCDCGWAMEKVVRNG